MLVNKKEEDGAIFNGAILYVSVPGSDMSYDGKMLESGIPVLINFNNTDCMVLFDYLLRASGLKSPVDVQGQCSRGLSSLRNAFRKLKLFVKKKKKKEVFF